MLKFWLRSSLFDEAATGDGGGGSGGGSGAGADNSGKQFDPVAFETKILGEIDSRLNKTINGFGKSFKNDIQKMLEVFKPAASTGSGANGGTGDGTGASGTGDGTGTTTGTDPKLNALQLELKRDRETSAARIKALEDENSANKKKAEDMAIDGSLRDAFGKFEFISPEAQKSAMQIFKPMIERSEDGSLIAGGLPLEKYIETELPAKHAYFIKAKDVGGAGARPGKPGGTKKWDLDTVLKPENFSKLTAQEQAEVRQVVLTTQ